MTLRALDKAYHIRPAGRGESVELMEAMKQAFETVAMAKVSMSAFEARNLGFISSGDDITMNRERVLTDAKDRALELADAGGASFVRLQRIAVYWTHCTETAAAIEAGSKPHSARWNFCDPYKPET